MIHRENQYDLVLRLASESEDRAETGQLPGLPMKASESEA